MGFLLEAKGFIVVHGGEILFCIIVSLNNLSVNRGPTWSLGHDIVIVSLFIEKNKINQIVSVFALLHLSVCVFEDKIVH